MKRDNFTDTVIGSDAPSCWVAAMRGGERLWAVGSAKLSGVAPV